MPVNISNTFSNFNIRESQEVSSRKRDHCNNSNLPVDYRNRTTKPFTSYLQSKPPQTRRYQRDSSVGSRLKYTYSKENLVKKHKHSHVNNSINTEFAKLKNEQLTSRKKYN